MSPRWNGPSAPGSRVRPSPGHVAIDGKRLRGSATAQAAGTHLLAAFSASLQGVIGQLRVDPDANEITAVLQLLKTLPLKGVTFNRRRIVRAEGDLQGHHRRRRGFFTGKGTSPRCKRISPRPSGRFPPSAVWSPPSDLQERPKR